jgi:hypothetical protein
MVRRNARRADTAGPGADDEEIVVESHVARLDIADIGLPPQSIGRSSAPQ